MKRTYSLILFLNAFLLPATLLAQGSDSRLLTPALGHYKQLAAFDSSPTPDGAELDKLKYPFDAPLAERRLSLKPIYLVNVKLEDFKVPEMPANSSARTRAELKYLMALQRTRTSEDVRTSLHMANVYYNLRVKPTDTTYARYRRNLFQIGRSIGSWFNPDTLPLTTELMARVWQDASYFTWSLKYHFARVRPYKLETGLRNLEETNWEAYPSGHAANSYINAYVFSELASEFAAYFVKDAYDMAHSREILGVHYPSDSEASRIFARQFVNKLFQNDQFLKDFEKVKSEWALYAREKLD